MSYQTQAITMKTKKTNNKQERPKWFKGAWYKTGDIVENPFSGEFCELTGPELSMYDFIKGSEMCMSAGWNINSKIRNQFDKALSWFIKNNPKAYMALLD